MAWRSSYQHLTGCQFVYLSLSLTQQHALKKGWLEELGFFIIRKAFLDLRVDSQEMCCLNHSIDQALERVWILEPKVPSVLGHRVFGVILEGLSLVCSFWGSQIRNTRLSPRFLSEDNL